MRSCRGPAPVRRRGSPRCLPWRRWRSRRRSSGCCSAGVHGARRATARPPGRPPRAAVDSWRSPRASPLDALAHASLAAHMTQHTLLTVVAAPLLAAARPLAVFAAALPRAVRLPRFLVVPSPGVACALHAVALWAWHLPGPYGAALG